MPYAHRNITYGLPTDPYDPGIVADHVQDLVCALGLSRRPVGVKLLGRKQYEETVAEEPRSPLAYCMLVEQASRGRISKSRAATQNCDGGTTALGLEASTEEIESGRTYFSYNLYATVGAARRMRASIRSLHREGAGTYGVLVGPADQMPVAPDVVIIPVSPYQAMRVVQGYEYHTGIKPSMDYGAMQAVCAEATAVPYLSGQMNITALCPSTRMLARWGDDEMIAALPYERFGDTVEGVIATINSTDLKRRKQEIVERFAARGKILPLDMNGGADSDQSRKA